MSWWLGVPYGAIGTGTEFGGWQLVLSPLSFRPQQSGVEKSHCSMVQDALLWNKMIEVYSITKKPLFRGAFFVAL